MRRPIRPARARVVAALAATAVMALGLVACGTRLPDRDFLGAGAVNGSSGNPVAGASGSQSATGNGGTNTQTPGAVSGGGGAAGGASGGVGGGTGGGGGKTGGGGAAGGGG